MSDRESKGLIHDCEECMNELISLMTGNTDGTFVGCLTLLNKFLRTEEKTKYDWLLTTSDNEITKRLLNQRIMASFLEINHYRKRKGIPLDKSRSAFLEMVEAGNIQYDNILEISESFGFLMLVDAFQYYWHPSPIFRSNAIIEAEESGFKGKLQAIYPLVDVEHSLIKEREFTVKEQILFNFIDIVILEVERLLFNNNRLIFPSSGYMQEIRNILKEQIGSDDESLSFQNNALESFKSCLDIEDGISYEKILIVEILYKILSLKAGGFLTDFEWLFMKSVPNIVSSIYDLCYFYDRYQEFIILALINNWYYYQFETILQDCEIFKALKEKEIARLRKHNE